MPEVPPAPAPGQEDEPYPTALARILAWRAATLPRFRALMLLRRLGMLAEQHGDLPESERLAMSLHEARTRAVRDALPEQRGWDLPGSGVPAYLELQDSLAAWLGALPIDAILQVLRAASRASGPVHGSAEADIESQLRGIGRRFELGGGRPPRKVPPMGGGGPAREEAAEPAPEPEPAAGEAREEASAWVPPMGGGEPEREEAAESAPDEREYGGVASDGPAPQAEREESAAEPEAVPANGGGETRIVAANGGSRAKPPEPAERYVGTGFAAAEHPGEGMAGTTTLAAGEKYWFWLEISEEVPEHSIETEHAPFPREHLAVSTELTVALFPVPGGLLPDPDASSGALRAAEDGSVRAHRQPARWTAAAAGAMRGLLEHRLLFPVRTPAQPGDCAMRCSIYHGQTLVQSRLVRAKVTAAPETADHALTSTLDYTLSRTLRPGYLEQLPDHLLSLMVNRNQDGSHGFFFKGEQEFRSTAAVAELKVQGMIERARKSMRKASWKSEAEWTKGTPYRYQDGALDPGRLRDDLLSLAVAGLRLYDSIANQLADGAQGARALRDLMRRPGSVQIVNKVSPSFILPAALFYDYR
ncbi:MAG TPA: hypothetical protein VEW03_02980, partial [Longimicrobiaceae bacterium]|nr:hypothetical protein [Longimicrobiaceae bacterium]